MRFQLKARLRSGTQLRGSFVFSRDPAVTEIIAAAGFDVVILDREHGPLGWSEIADHARAARAAGIPLLVRVSRTCTEEVTRALDLGAEGVVLPHYGRDRASSIAAVQAARYAPGGLRGTCTGTRASGYGLGAIAELAEAADREVVVVVQIEDPATVDGLGALLDLAAVDVVMPGLADLASALGLPGQFRAAPVLEAAHRMLATASAHGRWTSVYVANAGELSRWQGVACNLLVYGIDYKVIGEAYREALMSLAPQG